MSFDKAKPSEELLTLQRTLDRRSREEVRPLDNLFESVVHRDNLAAAWQRVSNNPGSNTPGADGKTCNDIKNRLDRWLHDLAEDLLQNTFRPQAARVVEVPKHPGSVKMRKLGVLRVSDRVVHAALKQVIEPLVEPLFVDTSFGFRPGRSVASALTTATRLLNRSLPPGKDMAPTRQAPQIQAPMKFAVHLDVADCFGTIDHHLLMGAFAEHVADQRIQSLVRKLLSVEGKSVGPFWNRRQIGIVQGSGFSPLLCNLFLHPVDEALQAAAADANAVCLRYADDLWLAAADSRTLKRLIGMVQRELQARRLNLRSPLGRPVPLTEGVNWLGVQIKSRQLGWEESPRFVFDVPDAKVQRMLDVITEMTEPPCKRLERQTFNLENWFASLNDQLWQWREVYVYAGNAAAVFQAIDEHIKDRVQNLLFHVTGLRRRALRKEFQEYLPRGFWTWKAGNTRLVCLSSLAPKFPKRLVKPPEWLRRNKR